MDADAPALGLTEIRARNAVIDEPRKDVAHRRLSGLESPRAVHDPPVNDTKHSGNLFELRPGDDVASRSTHDRGHLTVLHCLHGRRGNVGIDVAAGHRDPGRQSQTLGELRGQATDPGS